MGWNNSGGFRMKYSLFEETTRVEPVFPLSPFSRLKNDLTEKPANRLNGLTEFDEVNHYDFRNISKRIT